MVQAAGICARQQCEPLTHVSHVTTTGTIVIATVSIMLVSLARISCDCSQHREPQLNAQGTGWGCDELPFSLTLKSECDSMEQLKSAERVSRGHADDQVYSMTGRM
jgi:hypothetical protein